MTLKNLRFKHLNLIIKHMDNQIITKQAGRQALSGYWGQYRANPWTSVIAFFTPAIGSILVFFVPPLIVAKIINIFASNNQASLKIVGNYILLLACLWLIGEIL